MTVERLMGAILLELPKTSIPEVCLTFDGKQWEVMAGGHQHVHIGEWGGDFRSWGNTAEDALRICLRHIQEANART